MHGPAALSFHCAASSGAKRGRVRHRPLPHRLPPLSAVCAALGQALTTLHGRLDLPDLSPMLREFAMMPLVSISNSQRLPVPWANWYGTVYHGLPSNLYAGGCGDGGSLAYIGRICPEKRPDWAIEIARRAGMQLTIAAKVDEVDRTYHETSIKPLLEDPRVDFVGEI